MIKRIIEVQQLRNQCGLLTIKPNHRGLLTLTNRPASKSCGLYWIYTSYTIEELCNSNKSQKKNAVNIPYLANSRKNLKNVLKPTAEEEFWCVYNGIGGGSPGNKHHYDLGSRILQEFRNNQKTGSLKILGTNLNDLDKWRYNYVEIDYAEYQIHKRDLETGWRLEYGWPILSKQ